ncbi:MAG: hypothetical protein ACI4PC_03830 [Oscillospiraceae bacterium]
MAINRYQGNSGRVSRVPEPSSGHGARRETGRPAREPRPVPGPPPGQRRPLSPLSGLSGDLGRLLGRFTLSSLETEDILLIVVLYLLYKESGDEDFLVMMAAMAFL